MRVRVNIVGHRAGRQLLVRVDVAEAYAVIVVVEAAARLPRRQLGTYVALVHRQFLTGSSSPRRVAIVVVVGRQLSRSHR